MEIRTRILSNEALQSELQFTLTFFNLYSRGNIYVLLGIGCDIPGGEMYQEIQIDNNKLREFIETKIAEHIYHLGNDDLIVNDKVADIEFTFCHEHDIHFKSADQTLLTSVKTRWTEMGYQTYQLSTK
jgi:hypothetical protein